jgi:hypothetical protein
VDPALYERYEVLSRPTLRNWQGTETGGIEVRGL